MLVYGSYTTIIDSYRPKGAICPDCNASDQVVIDKVIDVIHVMYVPIIPTRHENVATCKSCGYEFSIRNLDRESEHYWNRYKSKKRIPFWFYSGPILGLLMIGSYAYSQNDNENEMLKRLQNGNQNQIIEYKKADGSFSTMKTFKIDHESVWLFYNNHQVEDYRFIDRITDSKSYNSDTSKVDLRAIKELINDGKVKVIYTQ